MTRQCSSCGGFCKKSGCERENVPIITSSDVIAGLQMALSQAEAMIERQQHVMQRAMAAWDSTTHQKNGDGRLWQCMEELRAESHNCGLLIGESDVEPQNEPVAWQLGHRFYTSLKDAEYAWRNDCAFLGTSYVPEPLFTHPASKPEPSEPDCSPNHLCNGRMVHLPNGEQCDKCGETP